MIPTCSALMHTDAYMRKCVNAKMRKCDDALAHPLICSSTYSRIYGFTLTELVMVILIISLSVLLVMTNFYGVLGKNTFRAQAQELVSAMQMAGSAAAESDRRYEVIIDLAEQSFLLRQITTPDLSHVLEEEIIVNDYFSDNCRVAYVEFDDGDWTNEGRAKFRAGHSGWQYGGKVVLLDEDEQPHSVVINRLSRIVTLEEGDVELLVPRRQDEVPF